MSLTRLEKILTVLDIVVTVIYIALLVAERLPPSIGQITIPPELTWGFLITLVITVIITIIIRLKQRRSIERIEEVHAYVFFPVGTLEENKNLDYRGKHFHKKLIVNFKTKIPQAYYLTAADTSYGWKLIHKFPDMWTAMEDLLYPNPGTQKWCAEKGYNLNPWSASRKELLESDSLDVKSKETVEQEQFLKGKSSFEQTKTELLQALYFFPEHWGTYKKLIESKKLESPQSGEIKWCSDQIKTAIVRTRLLNLNKINAVIPQIEATSNDMALLGVDVQRFPRSIDVIYGDATEKIRNLVSQGDALCERAKNIISTVKQAFG